MADYSTFNFGGLSFPLTSSTSNTLLQDADPSIYFALDFCAAMLAHYIGGRLVAEATACQAPIASAVASKVPFDPAPRLQTQQFKLPMLAIYRVRNAYTWKTMSWSQEDSTWGVAYVLPPLRDDQLERLLPILHAVPLVLFNRIDQGHDPSYQSDLQVWGSSGANLDRIILPNTAKGSFGAYEGANGLVMPAWVGEFGVRERLMPETDFASGIAIDAEQDLAQPDGKPTVNDFVDFKTDVPLPGPP